MTATKLNESDDYRVARAALLEAEIALRDQREKVAALRRALPHDTLVNEDYRFQESAEKAVTLPQLFTEPDKPLILIHFMYGGTSTEACPMCSLWADGYNAVDKHVRQRANFALVAEAPVEALQEWAQARGWTSLRLLSSGGTTFKRDFGMIGESGEQLPGISVFSLGKDGRVRHFYTACALMGAGQYRGLDLLSPLWHLFDLLPEGRGDWWPGLEYH